MKAGWLAGWSGAGIDSLNTFDEAIEVEDFILFVVLGGWDGLGGRYLCL